MPRSAGIRDKLDGLMAEVEAIIEVHDSIQNKLCGLIEEVEEVIADHESIQANDDQYDDPELWWARPLLTNLKGALSDDPESCGGRPMFAELEKALLDLDDS